MKASALVLTYKTGRKISGLYLKRVLHDREGIYTMSYELQAAKDKPVPTPQEIIKRRKHAEQQLRYRHRKRLEREGLAPLKNHPALPAPKRVAKPKVLTPVKQLRRDDTLVLSNEPGPSNREEVFTLEVPKGMCVSSITLRRKEE